MEELAALLLEYDYLHVLSGKDSSAHYDWLHSLITRTHVYPLQTMLVVCQALAEHLVGRIPPSASPELCMLATPVLHPAYFDPIPRIAPNSQKGLANWIGDDKFHAIPPRRPGSQEYVLRKSLDAATHIEKIGRVFPEINCDTRVSLGYLLGRDAADFCARSPQRVCFIVQKCMMRFLAQCRWQFEKRDMEFLAYPPPTAVGHAILTPPAPLLTMDLRHLQPDHFLLAPFDQGDVDDYFVKYAQHAAARRARNLADISQKQPYVGQFITYNAQNQDTTELFHVDGSSCLQWQANKIYGHITSQGADRVDEDEILTALLLWNSDKVSLDFSKYSLDFKPADFGLNPIGVREISEKFGIMCKAHTRMQWHGKEINSLFEDPDNPATFALRDHQGIKLVNIQSNKMVATVAALDRSPDAAALPELFQKINMNHFIFHIPRDTPEYVFPIVEAVFGNQNLISKTFDIVSESVVVWKYIQGLHKAANLIYGSNHTDAWLNLYVHPGPQSVLYSAPISALLVMFPESAGEGQLGRHVLSVANFNRD